MTVESFLVACKRSKLSIQEMDYMTIGMCMDYAYEYFESLNPKKKQTTRKASQSDFDRF